MLLLTDQFLSLNQAEDKVCNFIETTNFQTLVVGTTKYVEAKRKMMATKADDAEISMYL